MTPHKRTTHPNLAVIPNSNTKSPEIGSQLSQIACTDATKGSPSSEYCPLGDICGPFWRDF